MSRNLRYHYTVTVLTPLHIGSGETIPDFAYHVTAPRTVTFLDLHAAAQDLSQSVGNIQPTLKELVKFTRTHINRYGQYTLTISPRVSSALNCPLDFLENEQRKPREIYEHIKTHGKPYLPGSSLKGAIRTALLQEILNKGKKAKFEDWIRDSLRKPDISKPHLSDKAEEAVWGDQHQDPLRGLRISDSDEQSPRKRLTISDVRVMGFDADSLEVVWKRFGGKSRKQLDRKNQPPDGFDQATPSFLETLHPEPETLLTGELSFNTFLLEDPEVREHLHFEGKIDLLLPDQLRVVCQKKYETLLQQELDLYKALNTANNGQLTKVVNTLTRIQQQSETFGRNEFLLQLSWGTGWRAKTVGDRIDEKLLRQINRKKENWFQARKEYAIADGRFFSSEHGEFPSPKTRRLVMEGDTPAWPLGWVKVSLEKLPEH